jgi:hypothetical protein
MSSEVQVDLRVKGPIMLPDYNPKCNPPTKFHCDSINKVSVWHLNIKFQEN